MMQLGTDFFALALVVVLFGSSTFFRKVAVDGMNPYHLQVFAALIYASLVPLWLRLAPGWTGFPQAGIIAAGFAAIITNVVGAVMFGFLLKHGSSTTLLASAASSAPIVTALLAATFLNEPLTPKKVLGTAFVLVGMLIFNT